jgi:hypothetical protein
MDEQRRLTLAGLAAAVVAPTAVAKTAGPSVLVDLNVALPVHLRGLKRRLPGAWIAQHWRLSEKRPLTARQWKPQ